jgi:hypothetical protein
MKMVSVLKEPNPDDKLTRTVKSILKELTEEKMIRLKKPRAAPWNKGTGKPKKWQPQVGRTCTYVDEESLWNGMLVRVLRLAYRIRPDGTKTQELQASCQVLENGEIIATPLHQLKELTNTVHVKLKKVRKPNVKSNKSSRTRNTRRRKGTNKKRIRFYGIKD